MKPDEFEKQLQRQPLRTVPPEWRAEILGQARQAMEANSLPPEQAGERLVAAWWREWLWPCPEAWAGIAALWMVILGLNATTPSQEQLTAQKAASSPSVQAAPLLAEQRRELARLLESPADLPPVRKPLTAPGPRSEGMSPSKV